MADFSSRLKELRIANVMSQKDLANVLDVSQNAIFNWENGKREPSITMIKRIAEYFNVSLDYLMGIEEPKPLYVHELFSGVRAIAAHFDGDEYTEEELDEIRQFAEFVKTKRKKPIKPIRFVEPLNAAYERTDVKVTDEMKKHDDAFFDEDNDKKEEKTTSMSLIEEEKNKTINRKTEED